MIALLIAAGAICAWVLAVAALSLWSWWRPRADATHYAVTLDGWSLALHELRPEPGAPPAPRPVILCHGIVMSRHCWLPPGGVPSVAEHLRRRGHHLWIVELRGSGMSTRRWDYGFADYADQDLPALVEEVKRRTGAAAVDWVGHSMGGLVAYARLARSGPCFHKLVTLGSPALLGRAINRFFVPGIARGLVPMFRSMNFSLWNRALSPFLLWGGAPWVEQFIYVRGMSRRFALGVKTWGVQRTSTRLYLDFMDAQRENGSMVHRFARLPPPFPEPPGGILALWGARDFMAPERAVAPVTQAFPGARVECIDAPNRAFGHLDLLAGPPEVERVAERIDRFLRGV